MADDALVNITTMGFRAKCFVFEQVIVHAAEKKMLVTLLAFENALISLEQENFEEPCHEVEK